MEQSTPSQDHQRVGVERSGVLLIKREVPRESIPPVLGSPEMAGISAFQKLSRLGQDSGKEQVSLIPTPETGTMPGTWKPENLSVFAKCPVA